MIPLFSGKVKTKSIYCVIKTHGVILLRTQIFAVLGGDLRSAAAEKILSENFETRLFGFDGVSEKAIEETLENADFALLPLPCTKDGKNLYTPFSKSETPLEKILMSPEKTIFFGANIPEKIKDGKHIFIDIFARDDLKILNAVPTAEGAIAEAILKTEKTLWKSNCLVVGFGNIGKALALRLKALGANVTVSARKPRDLAEISAFGISPVETANIAEFLGDADIVFNTVPTEVIGKKELSAAKKDALFIDLASKPGGIDFSFAEKAGISVLWLLSLPGKTAPKTAGEIIAKTIFNILKGGEINGK